VNGVACLYDAVDQRFLYPTNAGISGTIVPHGPASVAAGPESEAVELRLGVAGACILDDTLAVYVTSPIARELPLAAYGGDSYGGIAPTNWAASVDCGAITNARIVEIPVATLPAGARYVRFCADGVCWSPTIDLTNCVITGPRVFIQQVDVGSYSVSLAGQLYGDTTNVTLSALVANAGEANATNFPCAVNINADGAFTMTVYMLNTGRSYDITVLPNGRHDSAGTLSITTLPAADAVWEFGPAIGATLVDDQVVLNFAATTQAMDIVMAAGLTTVGNNTNEALAKPSQTQAVRLAYGRVLQEFLMMRRGAAEQAGETGLFPCF